MHAQGKLKLYGANGVHLNGTLYQPEPAKRSKSFPLHEGDEIKIDWAKLVMRYPAGNPRPIKSEEELLQEEIDALTTPKGDKLQKPRLSLMGAAETNSPSGSDWDLFARAAARWSSHSDGDDSDASTCAAPSSPTLHRRESMHRTLKPRKSALSPHKTDADLLPRKRASFAPEVVTGISYIPHKSEEPHADVAAMLPPQVPPEGFVSLSDLEVSAGLENALLQADALLATFPAEDQPSDEVMDWEPECTAADPPDTPSTPAAGEGLGYQMPSALRLSPKRSSRHASLRTRTLIAHTEERLYQAQAAPMAPPPPVPAPSVRVAPPAPNVGPSDPVVYPPHDESLSDTDPEGDDDERFSDAPGPEDNYINWERVEDDADEVEVDRSLSSPVASPAKPMGRGSAPAPVPLYADVPSAGPDDSLDRGDEFVDAPAVEEVSEGLRSPLLSGMRNLFLDPGAPCQDTSSEVLASVKHMYASACREAEHSGVARQALCPRESDGAALTALFAQREQDAWDHVGQVDELSGQLQQRFASLGPRLSSRASASFMHHDPATLMQDADHVCEIAHEQWSGSAQQSERSAIRSEVPAGQPDQDGTECSHLLPGPATEAAQTQNPAEEASPESHQEHRMIEEQRPEIEAKPLPQADQQNLTELEQLPMLTHVEQPGAEVEPAAEVGMKDFQDLHEKTHNVSELQPAPEPGLNAEEDASAAEIEAKGSNMDTVNDLEAETAPDSRVAAKDAKESVPAANVENDVGNVGVIDAPNVRSATESGFGAEEHVSVAKVEGECERLGAADDLEAETAMDPGLNTKEVVPATEAEINGSLAEAGSELGPDTKGPAAATKTNAADEHHRPKEEDAPTVESELQSEHPAEASTIKGNNPEQRTDDPASQPSHHTEATEMTATARCVQSRCTQNRASEAPDACTHIEIQPPPRSTRRKKEVQEVSQGTVDERRDEDDESELPGKLNNSEVVASRRTSARRRVPAPSTPARSTRSQAKAAKNSAAPDHPVNDEGSALDVRSEAEELRSQDKLQPEAQGAPRLGTRSQAKSKPQPRTQTKRGNTKPDRGSSAGPDNKDDVAVAAAPPLRPRRGRQAKAELEHKAEESLSPAPAQRTRSRKAAATSEVQPTEPFQVDDPPKRVLRSRVVQIDNKENELETPARVTRSRRAAK